MNQNNTTVISKTNLVSEWDFEANEKLGLNPGVLFTNSTKKAWWICKNCGHKWQTQVNVRKKGHGCPQCAHHKTGEDNASLKEPSRSLLAVFPNVIKVWNYKKNGELKPDNLAAGSNKKVWWKCSECGKEWQTTIYAKAKSGTTTCKECTFKHLNRSYYVKPGVNDLASCNKRVSAEWDYEKNGGLKPEDVPAHSVTKVWWKCDKGHRWQASVLSRTKEGYRGCPVCANRLIVEGVNDLATTRPDLANNWNYERNGNLKPENISAGSNKKVWWKCSECGHEWQAPVYSRALGGYGCSKCGYKRSAQLRSTVADINDSLLIKNPRLAKEWDYEKNGDLEPGQVYAKSPKKVWWVCEKGHEWEAPIANRAAGRGCPICANRVLLRGYNDLATINPDLAKEWDYEKNGNLKPGDVVAGSGLYVWWKCPKCNKSWKAKVYERNRRRIARGCRNCSAKFKIK